MSEKTMNDICKEAIDGWRREREMYENKVVPLIAFSSFIYGGLEKNKRKKLEKKNPELFKVAKEEIEKGRKLFLDQFCPKCKKENPTEAKFCLNCGKDLLEDKK